MTLAKTLHDVLLSREESIPSGSIHDFDHGQFVELEAQNAVRAATLEETAAYQSEHPIVEPDARVELEARAAALGVEYRSNISDEKLLERIGLAEAAVRD